MSVRADCTNLRFSNSTTDRIDRSTLARDHSGRGAIRRITPMRRLSLFLRYPLRTSPPPPPAPPHPPPPSSLFLASSSSFSSRASSRSPTAFPPFYVPSSSRVREREHERAIARVGVRGCARCFSPTTRHPLTPSRGSAASRVIATRYRGFLRRASLRGSTRRDAPVPGRVRGCTGSRRLYWVLTLLRKYISALRDVPRCNVYYGRDTTRSLKSGDRAR